MRGQWVVAAMFGCAALLVEGCAGAPPEADTVTCGAGTARVGDECRPADATGADGGSTPVDGEDGGSSSTALSCGAGTVQVGSECVLPSAPPAAAPTGLSLAAGYEHVCALLADGTARCWGEGDDAQLGNGAYGQTGTPVAVGTLAADAGVGAPLGELVALGAGYQFSCALNASGAVFCWGYGGEGQLGTGSWNDAYVAFPVTGLESRVSKISVGGEHACALRDGRMWCWGSNDSYQTGAVGPFFESVAAPREVTGLPAEVVDIAAGMDHSCALLANGKVFCFGDNDEGQLGNGTTASSATPQEVIFTSVPTGVSINRVVAGHFNTFALASDGTVYSWGANGNGELGKGDSSQVYVATVAPLFAGATQVAPGEYFTCITVGGAVKCVGYNEFGQLGDGTETSIDSALVTPAGLADVSALAAGGQFACARMPSGVKCWGSNASGQVGRLERAYPAPHPLPSPYVSMSASNQVGCAIDGAGALFCAGLNNYGMVGDATYTQRSTPVQVSGLTSGVTQVAATSASVCAVHGGAAKCWGYNGYGQLGTSNTTSANTPQQVTGLTANVSQVVTGSDSFSYGFACAVHDGAAKCWGQNTLGQLGNNSSSPSNAPVQVDTLTSGVSQMCAGYYHACAVHNGAAKCWGYGANGQLGNGANSQSLVPVQVSGLTSGVTAVACGLYASCAIHSGAVKCWGSNGNGVLGTGNSSGSNVPVAALNLGSGVTHLAMGYQHGCAYNGSELRCWGSNSQGQAGLGNALPWTSTPTVVSGVTGLTSLTASHESTTASSASTTWVFGDNRYQQLHSAIPLEVHEPEAISGL